MFAMATSCASTSENYLLHPISVLLGLVDRGLSTDIRKNIFVGSRILRVEMLRYGSFLTKSESRSSS